MKFVALWSLKPEVDQLALAELMGRRAEYDFPKGYKVLGEYWSSSGSANVVQIFEADDSSAITINSINWIDAMTVEIIPVVEWQEGLEAISRHLSED